MTLALARKAREQLITGRVGALVAKDCRIEEAMATTSLRPIENDSLKSRDHPTVLLQQQPMGAGAAYHEKAAC